MQNDVTIASSDVSSTDFRAGWLCRLKIFLFAAFVLTGLFCLPLARLFRFSAGDELYSYICLVPAITGYLIWIKRRQLVPSVRPALGLTIACAVLGLTFSTLYGLDFLQNWSLDQNDSRCLMALAFVFWCWCLCAWLLGAKNFRLLGFPLIFLVFLSPLPRGVENGVEHILQCASADASWVLLKIVGTPVLLEDTRLLLPGISIQVAPECSGIHSTWVLFLIALIAGHLFLQRTPNKIALILGVFLIGVGRNAFRIFLLSELSIHVNPAVLDSPLHHQGGPLFFAVFLVPFLLFMWLLIRYDRHGFCRIGK